MNDAYKKVDEMRKKRIKLHLHNLSLCLADAQETIKRFEKELEPAYVG